MIAGVIYLRGFRGEKVRFPAQSIWADPFDGPFFGLFFSKVDGFVPQTLTVNLRIVVNLRRIVNLTKVDNLRIVVNRTEPEGEAERDS